MFKELKDGGMATFLSGIMNSLRAGGVDGNRPLINYIEIMRDFREHRTGSNRIINQLSSLI